MQLSYNMIKYFYEHGIFDITDVAKYVGTEITEEDFHMITGYSYKGIIQKGE